MLGARLAAVVLLAAPASTTARFYRPAPHAFPTNPAGTFDNSSSA